MQEVLKYQNDSKQPFSLVLPEVSNTKSYVICTINIIFVLFLLISLTVNVNFGTFVQTEVSCFFVLRQLMKISSEKVFSDDVIF